jgi:hypothetical protein
MISIGSTPPARRPSSSRMTSTPTTMGKAKTRARQLALRLNPAVAFYEVPVAEAEELLIAWRHPLHLPSKEHPTGKPYTRPFGHISFVMEDAGRRAAVVILASTINCGHGGIPTGGHRSTRSAPPASRATSVRRAQVALACTGSTGSSGSGSPKVPRAAEPTANPAPPTRSAMASGTYGLTDTPTPPRAITPRRGLTNGDR